MSVSAIEATTVLTVILRGQAHVYPTELLCDLCDQTHHIFPRSLVGLDSHRSHLEGLKFPVLDWGTGASAASGSSKASPVPHANAIAGRRIAGIRRGPVRPAGRVVFAGGQDPVAAWYFATRSPGTRPRSLMS
jgi:hypothetical protein